GTASRGTATEVDPATNPDRHATRQTVLAVLPGPGRRQTAAWLVTVVGERIIRPGAAGQRIALLLARARIAPCIRAEALRALHHAYAQRVAEGGAGAIMQAFQPALDVVDLTARKLPRGARLCRQDTEHFRILGRIRS